MPADYLELHLLFEHTDGLDTTAERVSSALGVPLTRTVADVAPDDRSQDRYEGRALGMAWSLRASAVDGDHRFRLTGATRSAISAGRDGAISLDEPVRTLLSRAGFEAITLAEYRERRTRKTD